MLSRRTTRLLADSYADRFAPVRKHNYRGSTTTTEYVQKEKLYAFLFERDHEAWLCNVLSGQGHRSNLRQFVMQLHTTESLKTATEWTARQKVDWCQSALRKLGESLLGDASYADTEGAAPLRSALELDGYVFRDGKLLASESETQDVEEERGELMTLYVKLQLPNETLVKDCLDKSETHYNEGRPRDCISNARHYLELVLEDVAVTWSKRSGAKALTLPEQQATAGPVRKYLEEVGLLTTQERKTFAELYSLLSETGGHPSMSEPDQARIFRRLSLSMALFVLLRYQTLVAGALP